MNRRFFTLAALLGGFAPVRHALAQTDWQALTAQDWQARLPADAFYVLRENGTERAFSSPLNNEKRAGMFHCAGCDLAVYASAHKYDSGTGWPSFWQEQPGAVGFQEDNTLFTTRTEVHCARCKGHLGHVFDDGPAPTGKRHCINGVALKFYSL